MARGDVSIVVTPAPEEIIQGSRSSEAEANERAARVSAIAGKLSEPRPAYETAEERDANSR